ncbi:hypothetical protein ACFOD4_04525 [Pseudoroseomonas globiformis]|uniref:Uncharacterized protein n=1 Tax=Teichococcus globiformis TaxID=2307229 RepID=A0ABV7G1X7_9PROT
MAGYKTYSATRRCGCVATESVKTNRVREWRNLIERTRCETHEAEARAAIEQQAATEGLPALNGSPKQLDWALDIRARLLETRPYLRWLTHEITDAGWWINHGRHDDDRLIVAAADDLFEIKPAPPPQGGEDDLFEARSARIAALHADVRVVPHTAHYDVRVAVALSQEALDALHHASEQPDADVFPAADLSELESPERKGRRRAAERVAP